MENTLAALSNELSTAVDRIAASVVAVNARPRMSSSGVLWRPGVVVTAEHTVRRDEEISVTLSDGAVVPATLAGRDPGTDLAVLRVETSEPVAVTAGDGLKVGTVVLAVGRTNETGVNATMGILSAVGPGWRTWRGGQVDRYVRLDLTLFGGTSGGAVVNPEGEVLGIATNTLSRIAPLAIPAATVNRVVEEILQKGHIARGYLGVGLQPVALPLHLKKQLNREAGLIVLSVEPGGPAEGAGVLLGDVVVAIDGHAVSDTEEVQGVLGSEFVGKTIPLEVLRGGNLLPLSITVGERPRRGE